VADDYTKVIPPGQDGKIKMVVDGKKVSGNFTKSAKVHSNDPEHKVMSITIAGEERPYINVSPGGRLYLQGRYGESIEKVITLSSNEDDLDFEITSVESNMDDKITYKVVPSEMKGEYLLKVWKNPKLPTLNTYGTLYVNTNSEHTPQKVVQVQVVTKGAITVQPQTLNYGRVKFGQNSVEASQVVKTVTLLKSKGEFSIEDIAISNAAFQATIEEMVPGKRFKVEVTFQPPAKKMARQSEVGEMVIKTNDPTEPSVTVRLVARAL